MFHYIRQPYSILNHEEAKESIPLNSDLIKNQTLLTPFLTAISTICADDNPPPTTTTFVSLLCRIFLCTLGLGNSLISVLWQHPLYSSSFGWKGKILVLPGPMAKTTARV